MKQCNYSREALFQLNGIPPLGMSISLALQHLVAMIVGCVTPAIIIANALGLPQSERVLLIQVSLVMSAVTTLIELFPIGGKLGSASALLTCPVCRPSLAAAETLPPLRVQWSLAVSLPLLWVFL